MKYFFLIISLFISLFFQGTSLAKVENIFGLSADYALSSSYYSISRDSGLSASDKNAQSQGVGIGFYYDVRFAVYSGIKLTLAVYPSWETRDNILKKGDIFKELMLDCGVLSKRYILFNPAKKYDLWLGYGPALQYSVSREKSLDLNNYILNIMLCLGAHYQVKDKLWLMPELRLASNLFLKNDKFRDRIQSVISTTDFFKNGFAVSFSVGIGYSKLFYQRNIL